MKQRITFILLLGLLSFDCYSQETTVTVFDQVIFYDGYAAPVNNPVPAGVIRHRNDLYGRKLSASELLSLGNSLRLELVIKALCDNYDRIGSVNLAFVPKGDTAYFPDSVQRIELGRFITPFMNKNIQPNEVPYSFTVDNIARIFKDPELGQLYDFWIELQLFGVPYAANSQVAGCSGRNDVFAGTLKLVSNPETIVVNDYLLPLNFQKNLNDYQVGASDTLTRTKRTIHFDLPANLYEAKLYLITSNHGANANGEEYNRRFHYIYFDSALVLSYKPGETSCEPYRIYNTQGNGIYGPSPRTDAQWQSFSNWCPGAVIPIREIDLENLDAGSHSFVIDVPTAVFPNNEGYFPVSLYLQGSKSAAAVQDLSGEQDRIYLYPNPASNCVNIQSKDEIETVQVVNLAGTRVASGNSKEIDLSSFESGMYFLTVELKNNKIVYLKLNVLQGN